MNGERRVERVALRVGDVVTVGDFLLEVQGEVLPEAKHEETTNPGMMLAGELYKSRLHARFGRSHCYMMESGQFRAMTDDDIDVAEPAAPKIEKTAIIRMDADISEIKSTKVDTFEEVAGFLMGTGTGRGMSLLCRLPSCYRPNRRFDIVLNHRLSPRDTRC